MSTIYHAKYDAYYLSKQGGEGVNSLEQSLFNASVDLNPHQIEAALFALRSPLSKGVLLADEVGLGKTIEAGLVLCQNWAERKRHLLVVCPASLRKQWEAELREKFNLSTRILDATTFRICKKSGEVNPFDIQKIIICSYQYAATKISEIKEVSWDLVVVDEAHKLRNSYKKENKIGRKIREAIKDRKKILLTATPLQNSLDELYGLGSFIDEKSFGDLKSFQLQYKNRLSNLDELRQRVSGFCWRTLRKNVTEFVNYTERKLILQSFRTTNLEQAVYEKISDYASRIGTFGLPHSQQHLVMMILRKSLASSPAALLGTLEKIQVRLSRLRMEAESSLLLDLEDWHEVFEEELSSERENFEKIEEDSKKDPIDLEKLDAEIRELKEYTQLIARIGVDSKTQNLLVAMRVAFEALEKMGAKKKIVIFTESRRSQEWLKKFLDQNGYADQVLTFNGANDEDRSGEIYEAWYFKNANTGKISGSKAIDLRTAILDRFEHHSQILIATEAGAEGLNLQFCSAIMNYDLPWNPQRIEQRIGRCHRYGQKHDVVVFNFLNTRNEVDCRVHELLEKKFHLFSGIFGASDQVLGAIESGVDFEKRVLEIYQTCRSEEQIGEAFQKLRVDFELEIEAQMETTRQKMRDFFDQDVHDRFKVSLSGTREQLDRMGRRFWRLSKYQLREFASFDETDLSFDLREAPAAQVQLGRYRMISKKHENMSYQFLYRLSHPLGEYVIDAAKEKDTPVAELIFDISNHPVRIAAVEQLKGRAGWLVLDWLEIFSAAKEDYLLFSACDDFGENLDQETCEKLFECVATQARKIEMPERFHGRLEANQKQYADAVTEQHARRNHELLHEQIEKLRQWARDGERSAENMIQETKAQIAAKEKEASAAVTVQEKLEVQQEIAVLEQKKRRQRRELENLEDEIKKRRDQEIESLRVAAAQKTNRKTLFRIGWRVI